jgi:hypothetical protein
MSGSQLVTLVSSRVSHISMVTLLRRGVPGCIWLTRTGVAEASANTGISASALAKFKITSDGTVSASHILWERGGVCHQSWWSDGGARPDAVTVMTTSAQCMEALLGGSTHCQGFRGWGLGL